MAVRTVVTTVNTLLEIFKDYLGPENVPEDARVVKILMHPQTRRVRLVAESEEWSQGRPVLGVKFDLKRVFSVGGSDGNQGN